MDTVPGKALREEIDEILADDDQIKQIDEVQDHHFEPYLVINITVCVDGTLTVREGDQIATCGTRINGQYCIRSAGACALSSLSTPLWC